MSTHRQTKTRPKRKPAAKGDISLKQLRARLSPAEAARLLSAAAGRAVPVESIRRMIRRGAPARGGRVRLVDLVAWMAQEA